MAETIASIRLTMLKRNQVTFSELLIEKDRYYILMTFLAVARISSHARN